MLQRPFTGTGEGWMADRLHAMWAACMRTVFVHCWGYLLNTQEVAW